jgi:lipoyl(octanoyl) transferase
MHSICAPMLASQVALSSGSDEVLLVVEDLGRMAYRPAYEQQVARVESIIAHRTRPDRTLAGFLLLVEHDPVITISRRRGARENLVASPQLLTARGVAVEETDRGGDITYHGPGQLVVYPILDLNLLNLGLHDYMRMLEAAVIDTCADFGLSALRDPGATGVWTSSRMHAGRLAKICAMGVRVRRWVSMHGLALNVTTNLDHFSLIVPCGLPGRPVTSMEQELGPRCPSMELVKITLTRHLGEHVRRAFVQARDARRAPAP